MITVLAEPGSLVAGATVALDPSESHHLQVRRVEAGAEIQLLDGAGGRATGRLQILGPRWTVEIREAHQSPPLPGLMLGVGAGDRERFSWLAEKSTELGVTDLVPLETERTGGVATRMRGGQVDRLERRARESLKQCQRPWALVVHHPETVAQFAGRAVDGLRWLGERAGPAPPTALGQAPVTIAIGPEGGFTPAERALLRLAGFEPVSLGHHVLRYETAALAAAAMVGSARQRGEHD